MAPLGRKTKEPEKAPSMVYDGHNGAEITDWSRDGDLSARFQDRSAITGEPPRIRLELGDGQGDTWTPVPVGATVHQDTDGALSLKLPTDEEEATA